MVRLAIAFVVVIGCGGNPMPSPTPASGSGGPGVLAKKIAIAWGIQQTADAAEIFLATTDETGRQVSHEVGRYPGACAVVTPAKEMNALIAVACSAASGSGTELHAIAHGGDEIVVLKMARDPGVKPDPMAREEVARVKVPLGVAIVPGS